MTYYLIVLSSITYASKIKNYFLGDGDFIAIVHTPSEVSRGSCNYAVRLKENKLRAVLDMCNRNLIRVRGVYRIVSPNVYEEVNL